MSKVLLFGSYGMLGSELLRDLSLSCQYEILNPKRSQCDIRDRFKLEFLFKDFKPDIVINSAAYRDVDLCEKDPVGAFKSNAEAVYHLADLSKKSGSKFFHISTDYVFDGKKNFGESYSEKDYVNPLQVYGHSKLAGENLSLVNDAVVLRVQWLYGKHGKNFIDWVCESIKEKRGLPLNIAENQSGSPSSCGFVSQTILKCLEKKIPSGLYHLSHYNFATRRQACELIANHFEVNPRDCFQWMNVNFGIAKRPVNTNLDSTKLFSLIGSLGSWKDDLSSYLERNWSW